MLQSIIAVGVGGFFGSILRYLISHYINISTHSTFPFGTLTVNVVGSLLIGIIIGATLEGDLTKSMRLLLATGFCGGFTTFSSFSYEFFSLLQHEQTGYAFLYATASFVLGLAFVWLGFLLIK
ncbi:MAG: fluoride efflux transporter CrcB [Aliifodinibius sp.]|nr:fluoride efflux transporter CrcB [Fodinibius sp.]NIV12571.1 fluoride efflux transporter CrcB [Fodinibius sp.]NIY26267.1 fluoride efflux transporter CrcB [Fodinibius sp.]